MMYYSALAFIGIILNTWLYFDDSKNRGAILHRVDKGEKDEKGKKATIRPKSDDYSDISTVSNAK